MKIVSRQKKLVLASIVALGAIGALGAMPQVGEDLELTSFLNARETGNFLSLTHNVKFILPIGATMVVQQVKTFDSGNYGMLVKLTSAPHKGETAWVYYDTKDPAVKLLTEDKETQPSQPSRHASSPEQHSGSAKPVQAEHLKPQPADPEPHDKAVVTKPVAATQNKVVAGANKITSSKFDLPSAFACAKALDGTQLEASLTPSDYEALPAQKMANGQTQVLAFNKDEIKILPQGTFFLGSNEGAAKIFETGAEQMDDSTRGVIANYLSTFIQKMPALVAAFGKGAPNGSTLQTVSAQTAATVLKTCSQVKEDAAVSSAASEALAEIQKSSATPGGNAKTSASHPAN
jgi:hypothetical protein